MRRAILSAAALLLAAWPAIAQQRVSVETAELGMTGWRSDPVTIETAPLGMTGWRTEPVTIDTAPLGMTGWQTESVIVETGTLGMTGWREPSVGAACPAGTARRGRDCIRVPGARRTH